MLITICDYTEQWFADKKTFLVFLLEDGKGERRLTDKIDVNAFGYSRYMHLQSEHIKAI